MEINHTPDTLFNNCFIPGPIYLSRRARYNRKDIIFFLYVALASATAGIKSPDTIITALHAASLANLIERLKNSMKLFHHCRRGCVYVEKGRERACVEINFSNGDLQYT